MSEALKKAQEAAKARREAGEPIVRLNPRQKAEKNPTSLKAAISAMCYYCMGEEAGYVESIRTCSAPNCPLWPHRPYKA